MRLSTKMHCVIPRLYRPMHRKTPIPALITTRHPPTSHLHSPYAQNSTPRPHRPISSTTTRRRPYPSTNKPTLSAAPQSFKPVTTSKPHTPPFSTTSLTMSSDDAYMSFLDKANADLNAGHAPQQGTDTVRTETVDANVMIPKPLQSVNAYYISDADEPFEPVALKWEGASKGDWPSPGRFTSSPISQNPVCFLWVAPCCFGAGGDGVRCVLDSAPNPGNASANPISVLLRSILQAHFPLRRSI